jgi:hypothetical protein
MGVAFSPDGHTLACAAWDGSVTLLRRELTALAAQAEPERPPSQDRHFPLKGQAKQPDGLTLIGRQPGHCVRFEAEGLRLTLPAGVAGERSNTGVRLEVPARGDFEVSVSYEILAEPAPADTGQKPTKLALMVLLERADWTVAALARRVSAKAGPQFTAWTIRDNHLNSGSRQTKYREFPAEAKVGRLRIVRSGEEFSFHVAEGPGAEFSLLHQIPAGEEDLASVELVGSTGGPRAALDVRFTDLRVRTGAAVGAPAEASAEAPVARKKAWLGALLLGLIPALVALVVLYRRRRSDPPAVAAGAAPASVPFACPGCGKRLKAPAQRAGATVRCPGCGAAVAVPGPRRD